MPTGRFRRYELRTSEPHAARAFYAQVLGTEFWGTDVSVITLPERAAARGAPPHWLGHIAAVGVEAAASQLVARGAQQLGPLQRAGDGVEHAVLRDPFGAVLALRREAPGVAETGSDATAQGVGGAAQGDGTMTRDSSVAWHQLHTREREQALTWYASLFGWTARELFTVDLGSEPGVAPGQDLGGLQTFAWDEGGPIVGSISNGARLPHVHPQWLFFFRVADLDIASAQARLHGGRTLDPIQTAHGALLAGGEDPQGAAFGLYQSADARAARALPER